MGSLQSNAVCNCLLFSVAERENWEKEVNNVEEEEDKDVDIWVFTFKLTYAVPLFISDWLLVVGCVFCALTYKVHPSSTASSQSNLLLKLPSFSSVYHHHSVSRLAGLKNSDWSTPLTIAGNWPDLFWNRLKRFTVWSEEQWTSKLANYDLRICNVGRVDLSHPTIEDVAPKHRKLFTSLENASSRTFLLSIAIKSHKLNLETIDWQFCPTFLNFINYNSSVIKNTKKKCGKRLHLQTP